MKSKSADKIKMPSIDELLGVSGEESATDIEISRIHSFANHPFKVLDDDKMDDLVESIKQNERGCFFPGCDAGEKPGYVRTSDNFLISEGIIHEAALYAHSPVCSAALQKQQTA